MTEASTRSPRRDVPLRDPGQSLRERINAIIYDKVADWIILTLVAWGLALFELIQWLSSSPPSPLFGIIAASAVTVFTIFRLKKWLPRLRVMRLGLDGERWVGQALENLREDGYRVPHDICDKDFNIDHVLIGRTGIYAVETKTISKPTTPDAKIDYDGQSIRIDGIEPDRDPVRQAEACADRVREIIRQSTGHDPMVRRVVLFPGWGINRKCRGERVWVLNENSLPAFLEHEPQRLKLEDVELYASRIAIHVRNGK